MKEFIEKLIERLKEWSFEAEIVIPGSDGYDDTASREIICTKNAVEIVTELAEEYKGGWIPCSERLPEDNKKVLVSYEDRYIGRYYSVCVGYYIHKLNQWDIEEQSNEEDFKVFAWMPYPEPYKESED